MSARDAAAGVLLSENCSESTSPTITPPREEGSEPMYSEVSSMEEASQPRKQRRCCQGCRQLWKYTGPGWLMSIAYLDPGNIEADLQAGAQSGYKLLWVLLWSTVIGFMFQTLALRIGTVTGMDLAQVCHSSYSKFYRILIWIAMQLAIIASDIQEVIGSAYALRTLFGLQLVWGVVITGVDVLTFALFERLGSRKLGVIFASLVGIMAVTCFAVFFQAKIDFGEMALGIVAPRIPKGAIVQAIGILGSVIMPHNLFLHSSLIVNREKEAKEEEPGSVNVRQANYFFTLESALSLGVSFLINAAVVAVFATLHYADPAAGANAGLGNAATIIGNVLKLGKAAPYIWGIGLLASGQSATMTGAYAGQYIMSGLLNLHWAKWKQVLFTRMFALVPSILVAVLATGFLNGLDQVLNVVQSLMLPFAVLPLLRITASSHIMGEYVPRRFLQIVFWLLSLLVVGVNIYSVVSTITEDTVNAGGIVAMVFGGLVYVALVVLVLLPKLQVKEEGAQILPSEDLSSVAPLLPQTGRNTIQM